MGQTRTFRNVIRVMLLALVSSLCAFTSLRAHEVQPSVMDLEITGNRAVMFIEWAIEAPIAGVDLEGITDTNASAQAGEYDRLRALEPAELEAAFQAIWPNLKSKLTVNAGDAPLALGLLSVTIPPVDDPELARISTVEIAAVLPPDQTPLTIGWSADLGPLIVRQRNVEGGYTGYLTSGALTDPIPRVGASSQTFMQAMTSYIGTGFDHIIPKGLDHILFVLGLFFLAFQIRPLLWQITAFTLAHTVTLALGALDIIRISPDIVEPLIAASIVYVGIENIFMRNLAPWRPLVVFCFGLLHGLGFASVLQDFGLGADNFVAKLIGFNIGVEIGQLAVIAAAYLAFGLLFGRLHWYHTRIATPVSLAIALIALFWVFERTGVIDPDGLWAPFTALTEGGFSAYTAAATAIAFAVGTTLLVMILPDADILREVAGATVSFVSFLAITATFTSGAWLATLGLAVVWIVALRGQNLGGPTEATA